MGQNILVEGEKEIVYMTPSISIKEIYFTFHDNGILIRTKTHAF